eukprot:1433446-Amphidinium_carterae.2
MLSNVTGITLAKVRTRVPVPGRANTSASRDVTTGKPAHAATIRYKRYTMNMSQGCVVAKAGCQRT